MQGHSRGRSHDYTSPGTAFQEQGLNLLEGGGCGVRGDRPVPPGGGGRSRAAHPRPLRPRPVGSPPQNAQGPF